jgi:hypothetical protein
MDLLSSHQAVFEESEGFSIVVLCCIAVVVIHCYAACIALVVVSCNTACLGLPSYVIVLMLLGNWSF